MPCDLNGECQSPLGSNTIGLIYVNPEGHLGQPEPVGSAQDIRDVFGRMDMNDTETVALIGGGHAVGKAHGACPAGPGPAPVEDPLNPWPGLCGSGRGEDTFTSGFELPFTTRPTQWDNEYFRNLLDYEWSVLMGPGGHFQWEPVVSADQVPPTAVSADGSHNQTIGLLTSDVALVHDGQYRRIVAHFAEDWSDFSAQFAAAWYKLTTRDMGPRSRCSNQDTAPPPQHWQNPLPPREVPVPDWEGVRERIQVVLEEKEEAYGLFTRLAWQCSSTFRGTDYLGGCNGARIR